MLSGMYLILLCLGGQLHVWEEVAVLLWICQRFSCLWVDLAQVLLPQLHHLHGRDGLLSPSLPRCVSCSELEPHQITPPPKA